MFVFLGLSRVDFVQQETGEAIRGWQFWVAEPGTSPSYGLIPVKKWLSDADYERLITPLGDSTVLEKYAGKQVDLVVSLNGKLRGISFPQLSQK